MATSEFTAKNVDLTPWAGTFEGRRELLTLSGNASVRDKIAMADYLALQAVEIVEHWPTEKPMPMVLADHIRALQSILCSLESGTRDMETGK